MATTPSQIAKLLEEEGIKHTLSEDSRHIAVVFETRNYRDTKGRNDLRLIILPEEEGNFIKFFVPTAYKCDPGLTSFNRLSLFQVLLHISWMTKMLQFEYDPDDGEIRMMIEFPVEDSTLTRRQLTRCISCIVGAAETYHENIIDALDHGITLESESQTKRLFEEFMRQRRAERRQGLQEPQ
jgi:hypothetical protein